MNKLIRYTIDGTERYAYVVSYLPRGVLVDGGRGVEYVPSGWIVKEFR